jgi:hypothetical protein
MPFRPDSINDQEKIEELVQPEGGLRAGMTFRKIINHVVRRGWTILAGESYRDFPSSLQ